MQFLYPNVLFLILLPIILLMFLILTNKDSFEKYFSKEVLAKLSVSNTNLNKKARNVLMFISIIFMIIALARPVSNQKEISMKQEAANLVIAIDVSKSMLANDIKPNRLSLAKQKVIEIIKNSKENALAVIVFAKSSFILSPITQDFNSLEILVDNFDTSINFENGSNIFSTIESTNKLLKDYENKNLLILSDGGNNIDFSKEIEYANKHNIKIYTIGLASKNASPIKLPNGNFLTKEDGSIVTVALNENIKDLSFATNGGYINFTNNNNDIISILEDINANAKKEQLESKKIKVYTELFYYPLALGIFFLLISISSLPNFRKNSLVIFALLFTFNNENLKASILDFQNIKKANEAYENSDYKTSSKEFEKVLRTNESFYNLGNSLYKEQKYKEALSRYKNIATSNKELEYKKLHNMGNTYVKLNDLENAKKMYEKALKLKDDKQTKENLELVKKALNQQKQDKNQENNKNQKNKEKQNQQEQNSQNKEENQNENQDSKQNSQNNKEKESKAKEDKNQKADLEKQNNNSKQKQEKNTKINQEEISNLEEKKWLDSLNNKKNKILLKEVDTKNEDTSSNPW